LILIQCCGTESSPEWLAKCIEPLFYCGGSYKAANSSSIAIARRSGTLIKHAQEPQVDQESQQEVPPTAELSSSDNSGWARVGSSTGLIEAVISTMAAGILGLWKESWLRTDVGMVWTGTRIAELWLRVDTCGKQY
jgi:hypothetical protein